MKTYTIKITGNGTAEYIETGLKIAIWSIKDVDRKEESERTIDGLTIQTVIKRQGGVMKKKTNAELIEAIRKTYELISQTEHDYKHESNIVPKSEVLKYLQPFIDSQL